MESDSTAIDHHQLQSIHSPDEPATEQRVESVTVSTILPKTESNGFFGKHRMAAAISNLHNQINFLQEELEKLETLGESSIVCKELISSVDSIPDPLLPWSEGPTNMSWDRWFGGAHNSKKRWI